MWPHPGPAEGRRHRRPLNPLFCEDIKKGLPRRHGSDTFSPRPFGVLFIEILVSSIASYPERWRDGPCETLATCESKVPIPAAKRGEMSSCVELTQPSKGPERSGPFGFQFLDLLGRRGLG